MSGRYRKMLADRMRNETEDWVSGSGAFSRDWNVPESGQAPQHKGLGNLIVFMVLLTVFLVMGAVSIILVLQKV